jgi:enoyl-CoA hydratase
MILTGRIVEAAEAHRIGLVTEITGPGEHLERALAYAEALAAFPQDTMLADRSAALEGVGRPFDEGMRLEARAARPTLAAAWTGASRFASGEGRGGAGAGV